MHARRHYSPTVMFRGTSCIKGLHHQVLTIQELENLSLLKKLDYFALHFNKLFSLPKILMKRIG